MGFIGIVVLLAQQVRSPLERPRFTLSSEFGPGPTLLESALEAAGELRVLMPVGFGDPGPEHLLWLVAVPVVYAVVAYALLERASLLLVLAHCGAFVAVVAVLSAGVQLSGSWEPVARWVVLGVAVGLVAVGGYRVWRRGGGLSWWCYPLVLGCCLVLRWLGVAAGPHVVVFGVVGVVACATRSGWLWAVGVVFVIFSWGVDRVYMGMVVEAWRRPGVVDFQGVRDFADLLVLLAPVLVGVVFWRLGRPRGRWIV
ncbi:hypothetical protein M8C13_39050 [Crossiella sp. SN42]|uniref:hypothetical protein n=1 Tax=Crossiella sp. SN42 TaxID=2944808 RepID=UPI00207C5C1F|nr:hypothetical protein [Crossiella sp. SN42]MCO1581765.1 hypothetical protein [Crossiella sp. SN42]